MPLKIKYGDRTDWKRITKRSYTQAYIQDQAFTGYITALHIERCIEPLYVVYGTKKLCIVDNGYTWVHYFPDDGFHVITTMFDAEGKIVQWYIDVCLNKSLNVENVPFFEDLFIDIIVLPSGEVILKDADELEEAFAEGHVTKSQYELAWNEARVIQNAIEKGDKWLVELSMKYREFLRENN